VEFSWTDTTSKESSFEVVRADNADLIDDGEIVAKVPYALKGCGRQFSSIALTDQEASMNPGQTYVYGVRALNEADHWESSLTYTKYRVPWMGTIGVEVNTEGESPVAGTEVKVCHYTKDELGILSVSSLCWLDTTDAYGLAEISVLVSDASWTGQSEELLVLLLLLLFRCLLFDRSGERSCVVYV
jgi:hypothetical protein